MNIIETKTGSVRKEGIKKNEVKNLELKNLII